MSLSVDLADPKLTVALIGGAFGIASTLIPIVDKWIRDHNAHQRAAEDLESLSRRVAFLDAWFKAATAVSDPESLTEMKATVQQELLQLAQLYAAQSKIATRVASVDTQLVPNSPIRRALLLYPPKRSAAWIPRVFFYGFLLYIAGVIVALPVNGGVSDPIVWALLFVLIALAWVFRYFSLRMQSSALAATPSKV